MELTTEDKQRIEQEAQAHAVFADQQNGDYSFDDDAYIHYKEGYETATIYEREQQVALQTENSIYFQERNEAWKQNAQLEAERSELIEYNNNLEKTLRICLTVKPHTESVDAMKAMVKTLLENSLKTK